MNFIEYGNLNELINKRPETKGWVLENFIQDITHYKNGSLGIKWINEKKGFIKPGFSSKEDIRTYCILISGKAKITFPDTKEDVILSNEGDYTYFSAKYSDHTTYVLEDCVMIAVRWKEL